MVFQTGFLKMDSSYVAARWPTRPCVMPSRTCNTACLNRAFRFSLGNPFQRYVRLHSALNIQYLQHLSRQPATGGQGCVRGTFHSKPGQMSLGSPIFLASIFQRGDMCCTHVIVFIVVSLPYAVLMLAGREASALFGAYNKSDVTVILARLREQMIGRLCGLANISTQRG